MKAVIVNIARCSILKFGPFGLISGHFRLVPPLALYLNKVQIKWCIPKISRLIARLLPS